MMTQLSHIMTRNQKDRDTKSWFSGISKDK